MKVTKVFLRICLIVFIIIAGVYLYSLIVFPEFYTNKEVKDILSGIWGSALFQEITNAVIN